MPELVPIVVACDADHAWLEVRSQLEKPAIDERSGLVEGALVAIDNLSKVSPPAPSASTAPARPPVPATPTPTQTATPTAPENAPPTAPAIAPAHPAPGGIGLGAASEAWPNAGDVGLGPKLDVALPLHGAFALVASEGVRFGVAPDQGPSTSLVDVGAGLAWGAPYAPRRVIGFAALVGVERFGASPSSEKLRSADAWTGFGSLGVRAATRAGPFEVCVGIDAVARAASLETPDPVRASVPRVGAVLSIEIFYPAE
jgi:hypothetical protein